MNGSKTEHQLFKDETEDYEYVHSKEYVLLKGKGGLKSVTVYSKEENS
jgi:hypothetical protein